MTFKTWLNEVDNILSSTIGIGIQDCRDRCYRDAYDDEMTPEDFVEDNWGTDPEQMMREELFG